MSKTIEEVQKNVDDWAQQFKKPYFSPLSMVATMAEEVGEVARVINHLYGDKKRKKEETVKDLQEELGDVLFTVICLANSHKISLDKAFQDKLDKIYNRDNNRFERKKGEE